MFMVVLALFLSSQPLFAAPRLVIHLAGSSNPQLNDAVLHDLRNLLGSPAEVVPYHPGDAISDSGSGRHLILTLGPTQFGQANASLPPAHIPVLALFITRRQYRDTASSHPSSAIYYEPPLERQILLGSLIFPQTTRVAVLSSPDYHRDYSGLSRRLEKQGLSLQVFPVDNAGDLISTLDRALSYGQFLVGTPDPMIYNRSTIKHILLTTYRRGRVLIGPTQAYVRAGALASTYTSISDFVREAVKAIHRWQNTGKLPPPAYSQRFSILVNRQVARSLNILVPSRAELEKRLHALEQQSSTEGKQ